MLIFLPSLSVQITAENVYFCFKERNCITSSRLMLLMISYYESKVREINLYKEGELTHFNQPLIKCHLERVWTELVEKAEYESRRTQCQHFNE